MTSLPSVGTGGERKGLLRFLLIDDCCSSLPSSPSKRGSLARRKQYFINQAIRNSDLTPKAKGRKSQRRLENKEESEYTAPPSIFTEACTNGNYVREQEKLLVYLEEEAKRKRSTKLPEKAENDQREEYPAYTPKDSFQRIDRRLRAALKRKQIPMGTLEFLEEKLMVFFSAQPQSVFKAVLESSAHLDAPHQPIGDPQPANPQPGLPVKPTGWRPVSAKRLSCPCSITHVPEKSVTELVL
ncbi:R3HD4 protein, partial [Polyodon spathula]|nr:R3HD4 protein [Polyodon spathula]